MILQSILNLDTSAFSAGLHSADVSLRVFERSIGKSSSAVKDFATLAGGIGLSRLAADAIIAGDEMINLQRRLQVLARSLNEIEGSSTEFASNQKRAADMLDYLRITALKTGTSIDSISKSFMQMVPIGRSLGIEVKTITNVIEGMIGAASLMGSSTEEVERGFVALRQIIGKNQLQMEELRGQLGEALPNSMIIFARGLDKINKQTGELGEYAKITTVELNKMITEGMIDGNLAMRAFEKGTEDFRQFAEARSLMLTGQMQNMSTIWRQGTGEFQANSGINTAMGVAMRQLNDSMRATFTEIALNAEKTGDRIIGSVLDFGESVASVMDQLAPFNSEILEGIIDIATTTHQFISSVMGSLPPEVVEMGIIGLFLFGRTPVRMFGMLNTTLSKATLGTAAVSGLAIKGASSVSGVVGDKASEISDGLTFSIDFDPIKKIFADFIDSLRSLNPFGRDPHQQFTSGNPIQWLMDNLTKGDGGAYWKSMQSSVKLTGNSIDQIGETQVPKEFQERGFFEGRMNDAKADIARAIKLRDKYADGLFGSMTFLADSFLKTFSGGQLSLGLTTRDEDQAAEITKFSDAYSEWRHKFVKGWIDATNSLEDLKNAQSSILDDMTASGKLKGSAKDMLTLNRQISTFISKGADGPMEKLRAKRGASEIEFAGIESKIKGMMTRGTKYEDALAFATSASGYTPDQFNRARFLPSLIAGSKFTASEFSGDTLKNAKQQTAFMDDLGEEIKKKAPDLVPVWREFADRLVRDIAKTLDEAYDKGVAEAMAPFERAGDRARSNAENKNNAEKALGDFALMKVDPDFNRVMEAQSKAEAANSNISEGNRVFQDEAQTKRLAVLAKTNALTVEIDALKRRSAEYDNDSLRTMMQASATLQTEEQTKQAILNLDNLRANAASFILQRVTQALTAVEQSKQDLAAYEIQAFRDAQNKSETNRLAIDIEASKLKLQLYAQAGTQRLLVASEITKLALEIQSLQLQRSLYANLPARTKMVEAEKEKLLLELTKLGFEREILKNAGMAVLRNNQRSGEAGNASLKANEELAYLQSRQGFEDQRKASIDEQALSLQKARNELALSLTFEFQSNQLASTLLSYHRQAVDLLIERAALINEEVFQAQRVIEIRSLENELLRNAQRMRLNEDPGVRTTQIKLEMQKLQLERQNLQLQIALYRDPKFRAQKNENAAIQGDLDVARLMSEYSMTLDQYIRSNAAQGISQFTDSLVDGLFHADQGFKNLKESALDAIRSIVDTLAKSGIDWMVKRMISEVFPTGDATAQTGVAGQGGAGGIMSGILGAAGSLFNRRPRESTFTPGILDQDTNAMTDVGDLNRDAFNLTLDNLNGTILGLPENLTSSAGEMFSGFGDLVGGTVGDFIGTMGELFGGFFDGLGDMFNSLLGSLGGGGGGGGGLSSLIGMAGSLFGGMGGGVSNIAFGSTTFASAFAGGMIPMKNGGIMTSRGSLPLHRYSMGGVASSPQLSLFGEGRTPEAFVPLPDGRSIPVKMNVPMPGRTALDSVDQGTMDAMGEKKVDIANYFSMEEVERHLNRNPNSIVNIITRNNRDRGAIHGMIRGARR